MSDRYKQDLSIEVLVGFFMFIILIALGIFTIVLSRQNFWQKKYPLAVQFNEISGLRDGDNVFLRGMKVGVVKKTELNHSNVVVHAVLDIPVELREGYAVEVSGTSVLGGKQLTIHDGPLAAPRLPEGTVIVGKDPINLLDGAAEAVENIKKLTAQVASGEGTLGKLIYDDALYKNLSDISTRLAAGEGTIGKLLTEETVYNDLKATVADLKEVSGRLASGEGTLGKLLSKDDKLYQDLSVSVANIRAITDKVGAGEGTLGKLVTDDQVYVDAQKLLQELRAAIDDMRETSPVTTFSTIFFGAF